MYQRIISFGNQEIARALKTNSFNITVCGGREQSHSKLKKVKNYKGSKWVLLF